VIEKYLDSLAQSGCIVETVKNYRKKLELLYKFLPENKRILIGTLATWRDALIEMGYSISTVNLCTSAANGLVSCFGHKELQIEKQLKRNQDMQPELTRTEYLRLLSTARILGKEREYLLIKTLGSTGMNLQDLSHLTVETVQTGIINLPTSLLFIPKCLCIELMDYALRRGVSSGPVFVTKNGKMIERTNITKLIQGLCQDARVDEKKATPRSLKKLYHTTQVTIQESLSPLIAQTYNRLLEAEQNTIGWREE